MKIGLLREGKVPPDARVPLTPEQCVEFQGRWPEVSLVVESSEVRRIQDEEYRAVGVEVATDVSDCDVLIGVKEVNEEDLVEGKTFMFFSHTYKQQPYNAKLLSAILSKHVRLIDYEVLKKPDGRRIIGFGRWAGIVGAYNGLRAWGLREKSFDLPRAIDCTDLAEMISKAREVAMPTEMKIVLTGFGRVGLGAQELLEAVGLREVPKNEFLNEEEFGEAVFTHIGLGDYNAHREGGEFDREAFINDPSEFVGTFLPYACAANMFIAGHFYSEGSPYLMSREDFRNENVKLKVVADVSCDIDGPVACTLRPSTVDSPVYGYDPATESECAFDNPQSITVMAVDNLPCELPRDASKGFGRELLDSILPLIIEGDRDGILEGATETNLQGELTEAYSYLADYCATNKY